MLDEVRVGDRCLKIKGNVRVDSWTQIAIHFAHRCGVSSPPGELFYIAHRCENWSKLQRIGLKNAFKNVVCKITYFVQVSAWWDHVAMAVSIINYNDVIMGVIALQITSLRIVYSTVYSSADQRKHQSSRSLAFVQGIHRWPVDSPHKWPVMRKMFPFDDVIMYGDDQGSGLLRNPHVIMHASYFQTWYPIEVMENMSCYRNNFGSLSFS